MKKIFTFIYQLFVWLPLFFVLTMLTAITTTVGCLLGFERIFAYYPGMIWSKLTCMISLCPVKVVGREKLDRNRSYIFVANHQGSFDIFLVYGYLGQHIKWMMKKSLRKIPLVGKACEAAGFIFVDNSTAKAALKSIDEAKERLVKGVSVVLFPEGSRTKTGKLGPFKKGAYQLALDLKLPIVPITINGSFKVMPIHTYLLNPHKMELIIHDPIETDQYETNDIRQLTTNIKALLSESRAAIEEGLKS